jgi:hypothetical protein
MRRRYVRGKQLKKRGCAEVKLALVVGMLLVAAQPTLAQTRVLVVYLPQLQGVYSEHETWERTATVTLPSVPSPMYSPAFSLWGWATLGEYLCHPAGVPVLQPLDLWVTIPDPETGGWWSAEAQLSRSGLFQIFPGFVPHGGATWDFLRSRNLQITLRVDATPVVDGCWLAGENSEATVENATVTMVFDIQVAAEPRSWGRIKALFE